MKQNRSLKVIILAAGYATRLYPLTLNMPKCLLSVSGKSILDSLCDKCEGLEGLNEIIIVTNAKFFEQLKSWEKNAGRRVPVRILNDGTLSNETRIGAIGDLQFVIKNLNLDSDILMLASDNLFDSDLSGFIDFCGFKTGQVCVGLYDIKDAALASGKYGVLETNSSCEIIGMEEKPQKPKTSLIGMGVYYFPKGTLPFVGEYLGGAEAKDAPGHYVHWLMKKTKIFGFVFSGMWFDIGDVKALEDAGKHFDLKSKI